jgi:hypothetical protein
MPVFGELVIGAVAPRLAKLEDLDTPAWTLPGAEILQLAWEVRDESRALLPRAMHPAVPPYSTLVVTTFPESPVGPFALALLRLMGRAGAHPRGYVQGAVATSPEAVSALRGRWGFPAELGGVTVRRYHDRVIATVTRQGAPILEAALVDPEPISGAELQYIHTVTLAGVGETGEAAPVLVQIDPHYSIQKAARGRPRVQRFDGAPWDAAALEPLHPISASFATCDTDLPQIRFVMDATLPVNRGTRRIR